MDNEGHNEEHASGSVNYMEYKDHFCYMEAIIANQLLSNFVHTQEVSK